MTSYVVLQSDKSDYGWTYLAHVEARNADDAIRQASQGIGIYVAVPERSWQPTTVKVEQTTRVLLTRDQDDDA